MFDIGFWEMGLIGVVALIVIGPERLPKVAATVGFWVGKLRAQAFNIRAEIEKEINADELREALHRQEEEMRNLHIMMQESREKADQLEREVHHELTGEEAPQMQPLDKPHTADTLPPTTKDDVNESEKH
jgi:sec-independent protein translocase protein TatB